MDRMMSQYQGYLPPGTILGAMWGYDDIVDGVHT